MNQNKRILIVDDDQEILALLKEMLERHNFHVSTADSAKAMQQQFNVHSENLFDMLLLDVMLPDGDGIELCKDLRENSNLPIILLTANTNESDRVLGLELGADDYLQKPFNPRELLARIKTILRRSEIHQNTSSAISPKQNSGIYKFGDWKLDTNTHQLFSVDDVELPITTAAYELLLAFVEHPQRVLTRDFLLDLTKNRSADPYDRSIDILVSRLRQKFEVDPKNPSLIKTVRNSGYIFTERVQTC